MISCVIFLFYFTVFSIHWCRLPPGICRGLEREFDDRIHVVSKLTDKVWVVIFTLCCPSSPGCVNQNPTLVARRLTCDKLK